MRRVLLTILITAIASSVVFAGGYQLNLFGQRQIAMGHAGVGLPLDMASLSLNPGSYAYYPQNGILAGGNLTFINFAYQAPFPSDYQAHSTPAINTPVSFYGSYHLEKYGLNIGVGVYNPYGSSVVWEDDWRYQFLLQSIQLESFYIQPTIGYKINDNIALGVGLIYALGSVVMERNLPLADMDGNYSSVVLSGATYGLGFNAGVYAKINNELSLGISYRSEINMDIDDGQADFNVPVSLRNSFPENNTFASSLPLPAVLSFGLGFEVSPALKLALDANLTFWSTYEALVFDFSQNTNELTDVSEPRNYVDSWTFRVGAEYAQSEKLNIQAGIFYDLTPIRDGYLTPETPDADKFGFSAGLSYKLTEQLEFLTSVIFISTPDRNQTPEAVSQAGTTGMVPEGIFKTVAIIPGFSINYSF